MKIAYEFCSKEDEDDILLQLIFFDKWKYDIKYKLKELQEECDNDIENGAIIIPALGSNSNLQIIGFSDTLRTKIKRQLLLDDETGK